MNNPANNPAPEKEVISTCGARAVLALRHPAGTYDCYEAMLTSMFNLLLHYGDELPMSDAETLEAMRVITMLRVDLADIAGRPVPDMSVTGCSAEPETPAACECVDCVLQASKTEITDNNNAK